MLADKEILNILGSKGLTAEEITIELNKQGYDRKIRAVQYRLKLLKTLKFVIGVADGKQTYWFLSSTTVECPCCGERFSVELLKH